MIYCSFIVFFYIMYDFSSLLRDLGLISRFGRSSINEAETKESERTRGEEKREIFHPEGRYQRKGDSRG